MSANFCGVTIPTVAEFKLPTGGNQMQSWKEMPKGMTSHRISNLQTQ